MSKPGDLLLALSPEERLELELRMQGSLPGVGETIRPRTAAGPALLSTAQRRLWTVHQVEPESAAYNEPFAVRLRGALDVRRLADCFREIVARHESLRTTFTEVDGEPLQVISERAAVEVLAVDVSAAHARRRLQQDVHRPFDLQTGPLMRVSLYRLAPGDHILCVTMHHIVTDAWSVGVLAGELATLYVGGSLPVPTLQYADYAVWERNRPASELAACAARLACAPALLRLPGDRPRPAVQRPHGRTRAFELPRELLVGLKALSLDREVTLFATLLTAFAALLNRYSGAEDILIGTPSANRNRRELEPLIGFFVNTLVVRADLTGGPSFAELLGRIQQASLAAFEQRDVPFDALVEALAQRRDPGYAPVFQVMFAMENFAPGELELPGLDLSPFPLEVGGSKFDLTLNAEESDGGLACSLNYNTDLFDATTIERMSGHLEVLLRGALDNPEQRLGELPLLTPSEHAHLQGWNGTCAQRVPEPTVVDLFRQVVAGTPDALAVVSGERRLSYAELDALSDAVAGRLEQLGAGPEQGVGIRMPRSLDLVTVILATLKAGAWFVPLDPSLPEDRLAWMIEDSGAGLVVDEMPSGDGRPATAPTASMLAYILYTSGSTGRPKGVMVAHGSLSNRLAFNRKLLRLGRGDRVLLKTPISFDFSLNELFWPLMCGATLVVAEPDGEKDPDYLLRMIATHSLVTMHFTPAMLRAFLDCAQPGQLDPLRMLSCGADALPPGLVERWRGLSGAPLYNLYGPTEATIDVSGYDCSEDSEPCPIVSIGRPIDQVTLQVLDRSLNPVPVGVPGELCIGGAAVARGYRHRPGHTAERFVPDPSTIGGRLYRTGDLARYRPSGTLEFLGRKDHQVKVRGMRVELGEIEAGLSAHSMVVEAVVHVSANRLAAYIVPSDDFEEVTVRAALARRLPDYMLPADYLLLEDLPRTAAGKVDRGALPSVTRRTSAPSRDPGTRHEETLCGIWAEVLGLESVGPEDNFFELGGDSILSIQAVARAREAGLSLSVRDVFEHPTVRALAEIGRDQPAGEPILVEADGEAGPVPLTPIQHWFVQGGSPDPQHFNQSVLVQLPADVDPARLHRCLQQLVMRHGALRLRWTATGQILSSRADVALERIGESGFDRFQESLDLARGPLFRAGLLADGRLLLVIHHLAVDGVSWRILLADLGRLLQGASLGPRTSSFKQWAERLQAFAASPALLAEVDYWKTELAKPVGELPRDFDADEDLEASRDEVVFSLDAERTASLLHGVHGVYHTQSNDLLLAALGKALQNRTGESAFRIDLEGHGREALFAELDTARTVGWFTTLFPVRLELAGAWGDSIKAVKETLRRVPGRGLGYGVLRYLSGVEGLESQPAQLVFNYLGRVDQAGPLQVLSGPVGQERSPRARRRHELEIVGYVQQERLQIAIGFSRSLHRRETIEALAAALRNALQELIAHCLSPGVGGPTPSDFPLAGLTQGSLERICAAGPVEDIYPTTPMQQGMLFHSLYDGDSNDNDDKDAGVYLEQLSFTLRGPLDARAFRRAWERVVARHPALRTRFAWEGLDRPLQVVTPESAVVLPWHEEDWRGDPDQEEHFHVLVRGVRLDLRKTPMRFYLMRLDETRWRFLWQHHHALLDGWCLPIIFREVVSVYEGAADLPVPAPYRRYIEWVENRDPAADREFWNTQLAGFSVPRQFAIEGAFQEGPRQLQRCLSAELSERIVAVARNQRVTLNSFFQGAWALLVSSYCGALDVAFGLTVSGRPAELPGVEKMVGLFINTIPVRVDTSGHQRLGPWLRTLQAQHAEREQHSWTPLAEIAGGLFDSIVVFENYPDFVPGMGLEISEVRTFEQTNYGLTLVVHPGSELILKLAYDGDRFQFEAVSRLLVHLEALLTAMTGDPEATLDRLSPVTDSERKQLSAWRRTPGELPAETVVELFAEQAARTPGAPAVMSAAGTLSYRELERRSDALARDLVSRGIAPGSRVGLLAEKSPFTVIAFLGVLKAGSVYLPLDPAAPGERLQRMLADADPAAVLTAEVVVVEGEGADRCAMDRSHLDRPAYAIFTSGTSGTPKAVLVGHRGLANLALAQVQRFGIGPDSGILQLVSPTFDVAIADMAMALVAGARLIFPDEDPSRFAAAITHIQAPPSLLRTLPEGIDPQCVVVGGEPCPPDLIARWSSGRRLFNAYGPTECTVCATLFEVGGGELAIGRALPNIEVRVLGPELREVPPGHPGELFIGGIGVADGYLNRPALTAERFIPGMDGARWYRSGDLVRYREDGNLEFLGRTDSQVKIHGLRVELEEVEFHLRACAGVRDAIAGVHGGQLVAYLLGEASDEAVRDRLRETLPEAMVPTTFVWLDTFPTLPSGKIDRSALPEPDSPHRGFRAPRNPAEEILTGIWSEVLGVARIGIDDDFFALGGHSLLATRVVLRVQALLAQTLPLRSLFEARTIAGLSGRLEGLPKKDAPQIRRLDRVENVPLSFAQERMWFLDQWDEGGTLYTIPVVLRLKGPLDRRALEQSLAHLVERHASLRTVFPVVDGVPLQTLVAAPPLGRFYRFCEGGLELIQRDVALAFDLSRGPVLRALLIRVAPEEHLFYLNIHHIVADGWSMGILVRELSELYQASVEGRRARLSKLPIRYPDFAVWQRNWLQGPVLQRQLAWWLRHLEGAPPLLELPTDRPRPRVQSAAGATHWFEFSQALTSELNGLSRRLGVTLFMVLKAGFSLLFSRYSGQQDVVLGTPIANRNQPGVEALVGYFLNVLPLRTRLAGDPTFADLLIRVQQATLSAYEHQDIPFEYLLDQLRPRRRLDHAPVFQVMLFFQNLPDDALELTDLKAEVVELPRSTAKLDMTLTLAEDGGRLRGRWEYNTDLFEGATIERMIGHLQRLLWAGVRDPQQRLSEMPMLTTQERRQLLVEWNGSSRETPGATVIDRFAAQVQRTPDRQAVVSGDERLSYAELDACSDRIAGALVARGVGPEVIVGLCAERSPLVLAGFLGILKAGGAYVPLDPAYPRQRLDYIVQDSGAKLLLTRSTLEEFAQGPRGEPLPQPHPDTLAYMIYTSGSTGRPKGAMVAHRGMLNHLYAKIFDLELSARDRVIQNASLCFDISIWQLLAPLLVGATVHIVDDAIAHDPVRLVQLAADTEATILEVVPSVLGLFLSELGERPAPDLARLRWLIPTGEALQPRSCRQWFAHYPRVPMINAYGPTECSDDVTHYVIRTAPGEEVVNMPVGRPVINTRMYVLDSRLEPVPVGVAGELYVGGRGVGRGYLRRPGLTAETFLPDPFSPGARLYKTGDLARYLGDGNIEYLGRIDHQVKIRGFRIELGEIESVLRELPGVRESVVITRDDRLLAYVVGGGDLGGPLRERLPEHMIPTVVGLDSIPLTPNGKIDRKALPDPSPGPTSARLIPRDLVELELVGIWERVLGVARVGLEDNFFDLGGNSLLGVKLMGHIERAFGRRLPIAALFQGSTVAELSVLIRDHSREVPSTLIPIRAGGSAPPLFLLPGTGGQVLYYSRLATHLGNDQPVYGLQPPGLDGATPPLQTVEELAACYLESVRAVQPGGPYRLCGHSFGSRVAFEMAQQLGDEVALLAVFDTPAPGDEAFEDFTDWDEAEWLALIASLIGELLDRDIGLTAAYLRRLPPEQHLGELHARLEQAGWLLPGSGMDSLRGLVEVYKANARSRYVPRGPRPLPIALFCAEASAVTGDWGWSRYASAPVQRITVPGDHLTMMLDPHVEALAAALARVIHEFA